VRGWRRPLAAICAALAMTAVASAGRAEDLWRTLPAPAPLPHPLRHGHVAHDGARIYYATFGAGAPVILLHGGLANGAYWGNQVPALTRDGHRVILIDSRGHGRSSRDERPYTYELMESDVVAVMDRLNIRRAAVVGWSDGAIISLVMTLKNPERVTRVFAFAANMDPSGNKPNVEQDPIFGRFIAQAAGDYATLSPTPARFDDFTKAITHMWDTEPNYKAADLARITTPVAIVDGDHDEAIEPAHTRYLAATIHGAQLIILPGLSHFAMLQDPAAFNAAMLGFLDEERR
jgi:pimeloyl-ACP methyl ester carboxylesterase